MNVAARVVVASPRYAEKYEKTNVPDRSDSEDEEEMEAEVAPDDTGKNRSLSEVLYEVKTNFIQNDVAQELLDQVVTVLRDAYKMMKMVDADNLCAGKVWRTAWKVWKTLQAHELKYPKFAAVSELWYARWRELHHPIYSLAYLLNPEYWRCKPWDDMEVSQDVETMLKRYFPDQDERSMIKIAISHYKGRTGAFRHHDSAGDERDVWCETAITSQSPWSWWSEVLEPSVLMGPFKDEQESRLAEAYKSLRTLASTSCASLWCVRRMHGANLLQVETHFGLVPLAHVHKEAEEAAPSSHQ